MVNPLTIEPEDLPKEPSALEDLIAMEETAPEPGDLKPTMQEIIFRGDESFPLPLVMEIMKSAGYVWVYNRQDGRRVLCNRDMLRTQLMKPMLDERGSVIPGTRAFTTRKEEAPKPYVGTWNCYLHKDDPNRVKWESMGFPICPKNHIPNKMQVEQHMRHKHTIEWAGMEKDVVEIKEAENLKFQRKMLETLAEKISTHEEVCDGCGMSFTSNVRAAAMSKLNAHKRKEGHTDG